MGRYGKNMGLNTALDALSDVVEQYESCGPTVQRVDMETSERDGGTELRATVDLPVALCGGSSEGSTPESSPRGATLTDDGGLRVEFPPSVHPEPSPTATAEVTTEREAAHVTDDGTVLLTVAVTIDTTATTAGDGGGATTADGVDAGAGPATDATRDEPTPSADGSAADSDGDAGSETGSRSELEAIRNDDLPPYEDTEYLRRLYDSCDTFDEMSREIEMDVASETVRRYMIEAGVHDPTSYDTATEEQVDETEAVEPTTSQSASSTDEPMETIPDKQLATDGIGLPEDVQLEDVADAVVDSRTVHEVQRHLDIEHHRTRELLEQLNLLDLVLGRISGRPDREASYEDVATRIRQCTATGA